MIFSMRAPRVPPTPPRGPPSYPPDPACSSQEGRREHEDHPITRLLPTNYALPAAESLVDINFSGALPLGRRFDRLLLEDLESERQNWFNPIDLQHIDSTLDIIEVVGSPL